MEEEEAGKLKKSLRCETFIKFCQIFTGTGVERRTRYFIVSFRPKFLERIVECQEVSL